MRIFLPLALLALFLSVRLDRAFRFPYPPFNRMIFDISEEFSKEPSFERPLGSEGGFRDFGGLLLGMRRLTADIAWVSVLQYYGAHEVREADRGEPHDLGEGEYPALKKMVMRVVRIDPYFQFAYLYGAGSLALNLDRYDEGLELLEEGIKYNPTYWKFRLYVAGIVYKKKGEYDNFIGVLEDAVRYPDCPNLVKSCLANIYKARKNYPRALEIWLGIMEQKNLDFTTKHQAEEQIADLRGKLGL